MLHRVRLLRDDPAEGGRDTRSGSERESDLPSVLAKPARRALAGAGFVRLEQLTTDSEAEVLRLHGMGPKARDNVWRLCRDSPDLSQRFSGTFSDDGRRITGR